MGFNIFDPLNLDPNGKMSPSRTISKNAIGKDYMTGENTDRDGMPIDSSMDLRRVREAGDQERSQMLSDLSEGREFGRSIIGEGDLGRLKDDVDVRAARDMMRTQADGMTDAEKEARREEGLEQMQGQESKANRNLSRSLSSAGVKGGVAAQAGIQIAAEGLQARRQLERDLFLADEQSKRQGAANFANFSTNIAKFDLGQAAAEKNVELQSGLAFAELGSNARSQVRQNISTERAAQLSKKDDGGKK